MVDGGHPDSVFLHPLAVLPGDAVAGVNEPQGGDPAQADDDLRLDQSDLLLQIADAGILFL